MKRIKKLSLLLLTGLLAPVALSAWVSYQGDRFRVTAEQAPQAQVAIVLGAYVHPDGQLSDMLADRVRVGAELYKAGKVQKLLMSGDHGQTGYDEVNPMRRYAEKLGVPTERIFLDHAGFCTYDTMARARRVFAVDSAIVVTQDFHLARATYLARSQGIEAWGVPADLRPYLNIRYYAFRDSVARCKAGLDVLRNVSPALLGPVIPIAGDARATRDQG